MSPPGGGSAGVESAGGESAGHPILSLTSFVSVKVVCKHFFKYMFIVQVRATKTEWTSFEARKKGLEQQQANSENKTWSSKKLFAFAKSSGGKQKLFSSSTDMQFR